MRREHPSKLFGTTRLNGLDPEAYLRHVLERIVEHPIRRIAELLPWNCANVIRASADMRPTVRQQHQAKITASQTGRLRSAQALSRRAAKGDGDRQGCDGGDATAGPAADHERVAGPCAQHQHSGRGLYSRALPALIPAIAARSRCGTPCAISISSALSRVPGSVRAIVPWSPAHASRSIPKRRRRTAQTARTSTNFRSPRSASGRTG